jgi:predicted metal-dependent hydrolase
MTAPAFTVRRSARSSRLRVRVDADGRVEVVAPPGASGGAIRSFVASNAGWIDGVRARQLARARASATLGLRDPGCVRLYGDSLPVRVGATAGSVARRTAEAIDAPAVEPGKAVGRLLRREARRVLQDRVHLHADRLGVVPGRISVRDTRSRWGSCSTTGALSFSWRLVLAPPAVLDYVVVHELCHLRHHDHSPRFWAAVADADPHWRQAARWLKTHGAELHRSPY